MSDDYERGYRRGANAPTDFMARMMEVTRITTHEPDAFIRGYGDAVQETGNGIPVDELRERFSRAGRVIRECGVTAEEASENLFRAFGGGAE